MEKFYITTSIAYANGRPHIGHALELVQSDVVARYQRSKGNKVRFLTGTDEHGTKIFLAAKSQNKSPKKFVDDIVQIFLDLCLKLEISNDDFIRTTDRERHFPAVHKIWQKLLVNGDIYKKSYEGLYCVGHEAFMKDADLVDGICPDHKTKPELLKEENYFFRLSKYTEKVKHILETDQVKIVPEFRKNEILALVNEGLEDISFSRPSSKLDWGIPVLGDKEQTIYVWADALTNYISALGYGTDNEDMKFWPADVQMIGKDILRFHAAIWPAMLLSADLPLPKTIFVHGHILSGGQKMSKTVGNVVDPFEMLEKYGSESLRYYLLREIPSVQDGDFTIEKFELRYQADLANGLGNMVARVAALGQKTGAIEFKNEDFELPSYYEELFSEFKFNELLSKIWEDIKKLDTLIESEKPWETEGDILKNHVAVFSHQILKIARLLEPFLPLTVKNIKKQFVVDEEKKELVIKKGKPLFPRIEHD